MLTISVDDKIYVVAPEEQNRIISVFWQELLKQYENLPSEVKLGMQLYSRKKLYDMEKKLSRTDLRPARGEDPTLKLGQIIVNGARVAIDGLKINFKTSDDNTISACSWELAGESPSGG